MRDMSPEEFRRYGYQLIDWIVEFREHPENYPVLARTQPGDIKAQLPTTPPNTTESMDDILSDFEKTIVPGMTHWNHPGFFAYFGITASYPGILGELLTAALNPNAMLWKTSPAATELEEVVMDWLRQMLGLSEEFHGVITDGASASTLIAIAAAREKLDLGIRQKGMTTAPRLRLYTSEQAHSSVEKAAIVLGIGQDGVCKIPVNDDFQMKVDVLAQSIQDDIAAGWLPFCVVASVGTTATTSIDPIPEIAQLCQQHNLWLHIDGAYGGVAAIVPEMRYVLTGSEYADSIVVNPHKWMMVPLDCSAFYVKDVDVLKRAFSLVPEYLKTAETDVINYMDWGVQLGRRFRALKLWMVIRHFGHDGLAEILRGQIHTAQAIAAEIDAHPHFERIAPTPFSTLVFRYAPANADPSLDLDTLNNTIINTVNATGRTFMAPTRLRGKLVWRMAIGNIGSDESYVRGIWELIQATAAQVYEEQYP